MKEITVFSETNRTTDTGSEKFEKKFKGQADKVREVNSQIKNGVLVGDAAYNALDNVTNDILLQDNLSKVGDGYDFRVDHKRFLNKNKNVIYKSGKVRTVVYKGCCIVCGKIFRSGDYVLRDTYGEGSAICMNCCTENNKIDKDNELIIVNE